MRDTEYRRGLILLRNDPAAAARVRGASRVR
jgi:hypothetical protein